MVKKLGGKNNSRAGTGTIKENSTSKNTEKWTGAVADQLKEKSKIKDVIVKTIPIDYIRTDQDNPRKLKIDIELLEKVVQKYPIKTYLKNEDDNEWIEDYVKKVTNAFEFEGKQIGDFQSIVEFAAVLKSPDRLLHPVVVWKEESIFHLISGERRVLTHVLLGESNVSAKITLHKPTAIEIDLLQWEENIHREDMTLEEKVKRVNKFIDIQFKGKTSVRKLAKLSGLNNADAQRHLVIYKYPSDILIKAIEEGKITSLKQGAANAQLSEEELQNTLSGKKVVKSSKPTPAVKITKAADISAMQKIISTVAKEYDASSVLENLDLSKSKDLNIAFNSLLTFLTEERG